MPTWQGAAHRGCVRRLPTRASSVFNSSVRDVAPLFGCAQFLAAGRSTTLGNTGTFEYGWVRGVGSAAFLWLTVALHGHALSGHEHPSNGGLPSVLNGANLTTRKMLQDLAVLESKVRHRGEGSVAHDDHVARVSSKKRSTSATYSRPRLPSQGDGRGGRIGRGGRWRMTARTSVTFMRTLPSPLQIS
jgi:hypothetical protein